MEKNRPLIISVTGWSGSGKTTFCEQLITEIASRGYKTAAAKNAHRSLQVDKPGSDSDRFFKAGAGSVCLNTGSAMVQFSKTRLENGDQLYELFRGWDLVIAEGFRAEGCYRVEVTGTADRVDGMKNSASGADMIVFGSQTLAAQLRATVKNTEIIDRNNVRAAADIICGLLPNQA